MYRISEGGNLKQKPPYVQDKEKMFLHFLSIFHEHDIYVFADNVSEPLFAFLSQQEHVDHIERTQLGNSKSFLYVLDKAIRLFPEETIIYFAEDDYIYKKGADQIIEEGLTIGDYSSGYDHPDKYMNHKDGGPNPYIEEGGESTRVLLTPHSHWKLTNSCCMTFAAKVKTLHKDRSLFQRYCQHRNPSDFALFCALREHHHRKVVSCLPSVSTHGETEWLAKLIDWENVWNQSFPSSG